MRHPICSNGKGQRGFALLSVLILMLVGSLVIAPLLSYMGTGIKTTSVYRDKSRELYAADAGIEDAKWQVKYDNVKTLTNPVLYKPYDYVHTWVDPMSAAVNGLPVGVSISNVWVPKNIPQPTEATASAIVAANKLVVSGSTSQTGVISKYTVKVSYSRGTGETLKVESLGVWLPPGFTHYSDSTHLDTFDSVNPAAPYKPVRAVSAWDGNQAIIWSFSGLPVFQNFPSSIVVPGGAPTPPVVQTMEFSFYYKPPTGQPGARPLAVAWINTNNGNDYTPQIPYAWDADVKVFKLQSTAGSTTIESYMATSELRKLEAALNGDYVATGRTLMLGVSPTSNQRELLLPDSSNTIDSIPTNATVELAYLYWTGWLKEPATGSDPAVGMFWDNGNDMRNWTNGSAWTPGNSGSPATQFNGRLVGHYSGGIVPDARYLTMNSSANLSGVASATLVWEQATSTPLTETQVWQDTCTTTNRDANWTPIATSSDWIFNTSATTYRGHDNAKARDLVSNGVNLTSYGAKGSIRVSWTNTRSNTGNGDGLDFQYSLNGGGSWSTATQVFRGGSGTLSSSISIPSVTLPSDFRIRFNLIGYSGINRYVDIDDITISVSNDALYFDLSSNDFTTWTRNLAFTGSNPTGRFTFAIPSAYWNAQFKMRFYLEGFDGVGEYVYLDNIGIMVTSAAITAKPADTTITFTIGTGTPHVITANPNDPAQVQSQVKDPQLNPHDGSYYGCRVDVKDLIKNESAGASPTSIPPVFGNGNGAYKVAGVYADSLKADGTTYGSASFAGWSLVIVYSSPDTKGHQLFLYDLKDTFQSVPADVPDSPPMQISGFVIPARVGSETEVARLTMFVGEGDIQITGDYIAMVDQHDTTEHLLWDGVDLPSNNNYAGYPRNVWNGRSTGSGASEAGIDVDTFYIQWADNILLQGDTSAKLNMHTYGDGYVTIYKILSFRSQIIPGGALNYLIR
jgi:hypothetical protein